MDVLPVGGFVQYMSASCASVSTGSVGCAGMMMRWLSGSSDLRAVLIAAWLRLSLVCHEQQ